MRLVPPLIPVLAVALNYPLWQLGLLVSLFSLGSGLAQAPLGVLSDRYDRLYILPTGIAAAGASYLLFAASPTLGALVPRLTVFGFTFDGGFVVMSIAMLGVGIGSAVVHPTGYPLISANVNEGNKGKVFGMFGSFSKVGDATAPALIGILILVLVWEQILVVLGFVGFLVGIGLFFALRGDEFETVPAGEEDTKSISSSDDPSPAVPEDKRTYLYPLMVIYVFFITKMFATNGLNTFVPVFIVGVYAYSFDLLAVSFAPESVANFYFAVLLLSAAISQLVFGAVTDRYDPRSVMLGCLAGATLALLALAIVDLSPLLLLIVMFALGTSLWGMHPARDTLISEIAPPDREGRTFGYIWTAVLLTGAIIPTLVGYTIDVVGFREAFVILAMGTILAFASISLLYLDRVYVTDADLDVRIDTETSD